MPHSPTPPPPGRPVDGRPVQPADGPVDHPVESAVEPSGPGPGRDIVHEWGTQSFPASDPPANW